MRRLKNIVSVFGILLFILSAASVYAAMRGLSEIRPAESYEDKGVRTFAPYDVLPVQVKNTGTSRDRRMNPTKTVYMIYYQATDGSGYQWSGEAPSRDYGKEAVRTGETVRRRVLSIPEDGTYITVKPGQTAGSYTAGVRDRYTGIVVLGTLYILLYIIVRLILRVLRRLRKDRAEDAELDGTPTHAAFFGPEILEGKRRFHPGKVLLAVLPVILLLTLFWAMGHHSKKTVDLDFGWNENVWTCRELGLRFTLPAGGEIYDAERHDEERREKFGSRGSAGRTLLTAIDSGEGSSLGLLAIADRPSETFVLKMVTAYAESAAGEEPYDLEAREELIVGGFPWQTWRIEAPEQGRVYYYLYRQSGEYSLALTVSGPVADTPPAILTCFDGENTVPVTPANAYLPPVNGEGYCVFDVPPSLLGNKTPEELVEEWRADLENAAPEDMGRLAWADLRANEIGGVSYVCTPEQYQQMKRAYYYQGTRILPAVFGMEPGEITKRISYDEMDGDGIPWAVNVWIDQSAFQSGGLFSDFIANFVPMTMIGRYQIMCGVPADEWAVHLRLLDAETDAVLFEKDFSAEAG